MGPVSKQEADAWDRVLDAAAALADLMATGAIPLAEEDLEELTIFLARNGYAVRNLLKPLKRAWPTD
jgi:dsDNA-binding SOS-regulon protein